MKQFFLFIIISVSLWCAETTKEIKRSITLNSIQTVELINFTGSELTIKTWDKNEVFINVKINYSSSDKESEQVYLQNVQITDKTAGDRMLITFNEPDMRHDGFSWKNLFSLNFSSYVNQQFTGEIYLPVNANLTSDMRYGFYTVDGVKGKLELSGPGNTLLVKNCADVQKVSNNYGTTTIDHCGGNLDLDASSSTVSVVDFNGSIDLSADYSVITIRTITKDVKVQCSSGTLEINDVGGNLSLNADYTKITTNKIKGFAKVSSQGAVIRLKEIGGIDVNAPYSKITVESVIGSGEPIYVKNSSGEIDILNTGREIIIEDSYSKIDIENIHGNITINGQGSVVHAKKIVGNFAAKNEYGDIIIDNLSATTIEITDKGSTVDVELTTKPSKIDITNEYGPVFVTFPEYSGDVRLKASYGAIKTNLPVEVEAIGGGAIAIGRSGNGNGILNVKTVSGDIEIRQKK